MKSNKFQSNPQTPMPYFQQPSILGFGQSKHQNGRNRCTAIVDMSASF